MSRCIVSVACLLALVAWAGIAAAKPGKDDGSPVERIDIKGTAGLVKAGSVKNPAVIKSADEVAKVIPDEDVQKAILKKVDFKKRVVLVFRWAGSGRDQLSASAAGGKVVIQYRPGLTRDLRQHAAVFAVDRGAKWEVKTGR